MTAGQSSAILHVVIAYKAAGKDPPWTRRKTRLVDPKPNEHERSAGELKYLAAEGWWTLVRT